MTERAAPMCEAPDREHIVTALARARRASSVVMGSFRKYLDTI